MAQARLDDYPNLTELESGRASIMVPMRIKMYYARGTKLVCSYCGEAILEGSWYYRKPSGRGACKTKLYHLSCWRDLWLDL